jgi:hypothetical protein
MAQEEKKKAKQNINKIFFWPTHKTPVKCFDDSVSLCPADTKKLYDAKNVK